MNSQAKTIIYTFEIDGELDKYHVVELHQMISDKSENTKTALLVAFKNFNDFDSFKDTIETIKSEIKIMTRFCKYAILSDKKWIMRLTHIENLVLPTIQFKAFSIGKKEDAITWLEA